MIKKNIFLTSAPSSVKTTVIKKLIVALGQKANGFFSEEERKSGRRVGFMMHDLYSQSGYLAHQDIDSEYKIRRFGVSIENIETIAVPSIQCIPMGTKTDKKAFFLKPLVANRKTSSSDLKTGLLASIFIRKAGKSSQKTQAKPSN